MCSAASAPPFTLSVATKLTIAFDSSAESKMTTGMPARLRLLDRPHQRPGVERRQHDAADALALEALDDLDLLLAVVLAQRALPDDADVDALRLQLALGLDRAGVDGVPELVRRALRDDRDLIARLVRSPGRRRRPRRVSTTRRRRTSRSARRGRGSRPAEFGIGARREGIPRVLRAARPRAQRLERPSRLPFAQRGLNGYMICACTIR